MGSLGESRIWQAKLGCCHLLLMLHLGETPYSGSTKPQESVPQKMPGLLELQGWAELGPNRVCYRREAGPGLPQPVCGVRFLEGQTWEGNDRLCSLLTDMSPSALHLFNVGGGDFPLGAEGREGPRIGGKSNGQ